MSDFAYTSGAVATLRRETAALHQRLHHNAWLSQLLSPTLNIVSYSAVLARFWAFYQPLEKHLQRFDGVLAEQSIQRFPRSPLLAADLAYCQVTYGLGKPPLPVGVINQPDTVAAACGCLYVLEGSALGGVIIANRVIKTLDLDTENGCAFFASQGRDVRPAWECFLTYLEKYLQTAKQQQEAAKAAVDTFRALETWLQPVGLDNLPSSTAPNHEQ